MMDGERRRWWCWVDMFIDKLWLICGKSICLYRAHLSPNVHGLFVCTAKIIFFGFSGARAPLGLLDVKVKVKSKTAKKF